MNTAVLERSVAVAFGGELPTLESLSEEVRQLHRALPFTRLTDYGMDAADARELLWRTARGDQWTPTARSIGRRQAARGRTAAGAGRLATAQDAARAASAALNVAQIPISLDGHEKREIYDEFQESVGRYAMGRGRMEKLRISYGDSRLEGWLVLPRGDVLATIVIFGGLSGWGATYLGLAEILAQVGLASVLADGPGQGGSRLHGGIYGSPSNLAGFAAFVRLAAESPGLGGAPVGLVGNSFGGMIAARIAAQDDAVGACVINGSPSSVTVPPSGDALDQMLAFVGTQSRDVGVDVISRLAFEPARYRIGRPLLVLRGGADPLVTADNIERFVDAADSDVTLHTWPDGEHTLYNHADERNALIADWLRDRLGRRG